MQGSDFVSDNKKYYYLKLKDNFFDSDEMILLESMPDGYLYSNILLKLFLRSLKNEGRLMLNERIPFNETMLSSVTRHSVGVIEKAMRVFQDLGLIEVLDNGAIYMTDIQNFIGKSSTEADRKREYRQRIDEEKGVRQISDKCPDISPPEIELEKEKEIETEKEKPTGGVGDIILFYENNFGTISSHLLDKLKFISVEYPTELVIKAMEIASENRVRKISYVEGILKRWEDEGIKTVNDYELSSKGNKKKVRKAVDF